MSSEANPLPPELGFKELVKIYEDQERTDRLMAVMFALCTPALLFKEHPELLEDLSMAGAHYTEEIDSGSLTSSSASE